MGRRPKLKLKRSLPLRVMILKGRIAEFFRGRKPFDVSTLEAKAVEQTKLTDFDGDEYRSGLEAYVEALNRDVVFHPAGRKIVEYMTIQRLCARLNTAEVLKRYPSLSEPLQDQPMILVGTSRSGTTFLYNLLSLDPNNREPAYWETLDPMPPASVVSREDAERRIAKVQNQAVDPYNRLLPSHRQIHSIHSATQPEECFPILESTFCFITLGILSGHLPTYLAWLDSQPHSASVNTYLYYRSVLRALMYGHDGRRWLSKCPGHAIYLTALAEVIPDARVVHMHRNTTETIPSVASLLYTAHSLFLEPMPPPSDYGKLASWLIKRESVGIQQARNTVLEPNTRDLQYEDLIRDPVATVAKLYESYGLELTSQFEATMRKWLEEQNYWSPKKVGKHHYSAAMFGLDENELKSLEVE